MTGQHQNTQSNQNVNDFFNLDQAEQATNQSDVSQVEEQSSTLLTEQPIESQPQMIELNEYKWQTNTQTSSQDYQSESYSNVDSASTSSAPVYMGIKDAESRSHHHSSHSPSQSVVDDNDIDVYTNEKHTDIRGHRTLHLSFKQWHNLRVQLGVTSWINKFIEEIGAQKQNPSNDQWLALIEGSYKPDNKAHKYGQPLCKYRTYCGIKVPMISPLSSLAGWWYNFVLFWDDTYVAFYLPLLIAFNPDVDGLHLGLEIFTGVLYIMHAIAQLHIGFVVKHGTSKDIILDPTWVRNKTLKMAEFWFAVIPVLAVVITAIAFRGDFAIARRALQATRIIRIFQVVVRLILRSQFILARPKSIILSWLQSNIFILGLGYLLILVIHVLSCLYLFVSAVELFYWVQRGRVGDELGSTGYPGDGTIWVVAERLMTIDNDEDKNIVIWDGKTHFQVYLRTCYFIVTTLTTIGYGDTSPNTYIERITGMFVQLIGVIAWGMLMGFIRYTLIDQSQASKQLKQYIDEAQPVLMHLKDHRVQGTLVKQTRAWFATVWIQNTHFGQELLGDMPSVLRQELVERLTRELFLKVPCLRHMSRPVQIELLRKFQLQEYTVGNILGFQGEENDQIQFLAKGSIKSWSVEDTLQTMPISTQSSTAQRGATTFYGPCLVGCGAMLGILQPSLGLRVHTLLANSFCVMWSISVKDVKELMERMPSVKVEMYLALYVVLQAITRDEGASVNQWYENLNEGMDQVDLAKHKKQLEELFAELGVDHQAVLSGGHFQTGAEKFKQILANQRRKKGKLKARFGPWRNVQSVAQLNRKKQHKNLQQTNRLDGGGTRAHSASDSNIIGQLHLSESIPEAMPSTDSNGKSST